MNGFPVNCFLAKAGCLGYRRVFFQGKQAAVYIVIRGYFKAWIRLVS